MNAPGRRTHGLGAKAFQNALEGFEIANFKFNFSFVRHGIPSREKMASKMVPVKWEQIEFYLVLRPRNRDRPGGRRCRSKPRKNWQVCAPLVWWFGAPWKP